MYIYQAALVSKTGLVLLFLLIFSIGYSQQGTDSASLVKDSEIFLSQKINFNWKGGKLSEWCNQLSNDHGFKLAFSDDKIENVLISQQHFSMAPLSEVLGSSLENSGFTYLIVGRTIAIIKDKYTSEKNTDMVPDKDMSHIYPMSPLVHRLSAYEEKLLKKTYGKELRLNARHRAALNAAGKDTSKSKPSTTEKHPPFIRWNTIQQKRYYIKMNLGLDTYFLKYKNVSSLNWKDDTKFSSNPKNSLFIEAETGIFYRTIILATGIGFHKLILENTFTDKPNPKNGKMKLVSENYSMVTLPFHVLGYMQGNNFYIAGGGGLRISLLKQIDQEGSMKAYYEKKSGENFSERTFNASYGLSLRGEAGFNVSSNVLLTAGAEYTASIRPYIKNSLYKLYPHSLSFQCSFHYFF